MYWGDASRRPTQLARHALEQVCSGSDPSAAVGVYSRDFQDHVNATEHRGHDGFRKSLGLYQLIFSVVDLRSEPPRPRGPAARRRQTIRDEIARRVNELVVELDQ